MEELSKEERIGNSYIRNAELRITVPVKRIKALEGHAEVVPRVIDNLKERGTTVWTPGQ